MTSFIQHSLKARPGILQTALQGTRPDMKGLRNGVDRWTMTGEFVLNGAANEFEEAVLLFVLSQLLLKLRCKQIEKFGVTCDKRLRCV
jgi:hypothetical protein